MSGISLILIKFFELINDSLIFFTIFSLLFWFFSYKFHLKNSLNICSFIFPSSSLIAFKDFSCNVYEDILRLVLAFLAFSNFFGSVATFGAVAGSLALSGSVAGSNFGSIVRILSKFFIGNDLLLKLLRIFLLH